MYQKGNSLLISLRFYAPEETETISIRAFGCQIARATPDDKVRVCGDIIYAGISDDGYVQADAFTDRLTLSVEEIDPDYVHVVHFLARDRSWRRWLLIRPVQTGSKLVGKQWVLLVRP